MTRTRQLTTLILIAAALLLVAGTALAKQTPEQKCQKGRYDAAAKYAACQQKVVGKWFGGSDFDHAAALSKCRVTYTATWAKLQKKASGTGATCDNPRFADNWDGTVTDRLTGLQWEKKTEDGTEHDKDNLYSWSAAGTGRGNGTAFANFLSALNGGGCFATGCFAGQCDWRLPTISELQTILLGPYPCTTSPCIDQAVFGPTSTSFYWSATPVATVPDYAWLASFFSGLVSGYAKGNSINVRAVRAGL